MWTVRGADGPRAHLGRMQSEWCSKGKKSPPLLENRETRCIPRVLRCTTSRGNLIEVLQFLTVEALSQRGSGKTFSCSQVSESYSPCILVGVVEEPSHKWDCHAERSEASLSLEDSAWK